MTALIKSTAAQAGRGDDWDPYAILGIKRRASAEQIRSAYRKKAKAVHSDITGDAAAFLLLKDAHDFLMDAVARALWDRKQVRATELEGKKARGLLDQICNSVIAGIASGGKLPPEHANIPDLMRQVVCSQLDDFAGSLNETRKRLSRLKLMKGTTRRKGRGVNIIALAIDARIAESEAMLEKLEHEIRIGDVMLAELEAYECDLPPEPYWPGDGLSSSHAPTFTIRVF
jgi:hypothetical protein